MPFMMTPTHLHFIRNHGCVLRLDESQHRLAVAGTVRSPREFTLSDLKEMPSVRVAVTLTCCDNRRKEVNLQKHSIGFNTGAGATSCAWWMGVLVRDLVAACGGISDEALARFVHFDGNEAEDLAKGIYGTSLPLVVVMSSLTDVMVAFAMNDESLTPDHGAPMRLIVPGFIGGRSVKWLTRINVAPSESDSAYHRDDNLVLPAAITEFSEARAYFGKPEYTLYEVNINAVISSPAHSEWVDVERPTDMYSLRGYAYTGGGRHVTRVEVTLDNGEHWLLASHEYPKDAERHNYFYYTWCHWQLNIECWRLLAASEVAVRAVDSALNTQPEYASWNVHGSMNNGWYRVRLNAETESVVPLRNRKILSRVSQYGHERVHQYARSFGQNRVPNEEVLDISAMRNGELNRRSDDRADRTRGCQDISKLAPAIGCTQCNQEILLVAGCSLTIVRRHMHICGAVRLLVELRPRFRTTNGHGIVLQMIVGLLSMAWCSTSHRISSTTLVADTLSSPTLATMSHICFTIFTQATLMTSRNAS